jgi:CRP-like cAMP-binding protein
MLPVRGHTAKRVVRLLRRRSILNIRLIRKLEHFDRLSDEERQVLEEAAVRPRVVNKGEDILREGDRPSESTLLLEGFAARYNLLRNGKRQITALHIPGDFVDLHSFLVKKMDHSVLAITPCSVGFVPHEFLRDITESHRQWNVAMGRRSALEHTAHLLCELFLRLRAVRLTVSSFP